MLDIREYRGRGGCKGVGGAESVLRGRLDPGSTSPHVVSFKVWGRGGCKGGLEGGGGVGGVYQKWGVVASPVRTPPGEIHRFV